MERIVIDTYIIQEKEEELLLSFLRVNQINFLQDCHDILFEVKRRSLFLTLCTGEQRRVLEFKNLKKENLTKIAEKLCLKFMEIDESQPFHYIGIKTA